MILFEKSRWWPSETMWENQLAYYRDVLTTHANDPVNGECRICRRPGCPEWRNAYDHLAAAGEPMATPEQWLRLTDFEVRR
jgi:hypothetical protein